ncbi:MAG: hypothetical protein ACLFU0_05605 [Alphaproteobacteria bacterium]
MRRRGVATRPRAVFAALSPPRSDRGQPTVQEGGTYRLEPTGAGGVFACVHGADRFKRLRHPRRDPALALRAVVSGLPAAACPQATSTSR